MTEASANSLGPAADFIDEVVRRLVAAFRPERVVLFGSRGRGDAAPESDVELLVVAASDEPVHVRVARAQRALRGVAMPVDVFVCTPEEAERYRGWLSHTVAIALREGKVLYAGT